MVILDCQKCSTLHLGDRRQVEAHNGCNHEHHD
jgi:hypothetical protein